MTSEGPPEDTIKVGDFVIVQRQNYTKLHKMKSHGALQLGSFTIEMDNVIGERFFDTFQMKNSTEALVTRKQRSFTLEKVEFKSAKTVVEIEKSGSDNRNITDDGTSQNLTTEDIDQLKSDELNSNAIVGKLVDNSRTFSEKTTYSQEKYIRKKEKKYFEYVQVRRPSIRLLAAMFYRQDPGKTLGIRIDDLSQILTYSNVQSEGLHLLYDSGTSGLLAAAMLHRIGSGTTGNLIHIHPGNECQKTAITAMGFPKEQSERCINVNLYSILRAYHQNQDGVAEGEPPTKKQRTEEEKPHWQRDNERACRLIRSTGVDSLVIVAKEHPVTLVTELVPFLKGSRNLVVFSTIREPLVDLYGSLKERSDFVCIKIYTSFMREYQVLSNRTHPEVNRTSGGYVLTAFKLSST